MPHIMYFWYESETLAHDDFQESLAICDRFKYTRKSQHSGWIGTGHTTRIWDSRIARLLIGHFCTTPHHLIWENFLVYSSHWHRFLYFNTFLFWTNLIYFYFKKSSGSMDLWLYLLRRCDQVETLLVWSTFVSLLTTTTIWRGSILISQSSSATQFNCFISSWCVSLHIA